MIAATSSQTLWYLTRGTGVVSLVLLTASVVLGVMASARWQRPAWPRFVVQDLHRNVSLLVLVLLAGHILTAELDTFVRIGWPSIVVPFVSGYRPLWLGLGALSLDLLLGVTITSLLRRRIGYRAWRVVHWASYACWPAAFLHGVGTGTDTRVGWVFALSMLCLASVTAAIGWRLAVGWKVEQDRERTGIVPADQTLSAAQRRSLIGAAAAGALIVPVFLVGFVMVGPMRAGWAARSGTPTSALARP